MNVVILGNGAREGSYALKLSEDPEVEQVFCITGRAGYKKMSPKIQCAPNITWRNGDFTQVLDFARQHNALTIVGPEAPLVDGIVDHFKTANLPIFGPR